MQRILFITSTRIGDAVINSGVLDHLVRTNPDAKFTIACGPLAVPILENTPGLERLITIHKKPAGMHWPGLWRRVAGTKWDRVVDMRGSAIAYLLRAGERNVAGRYPYPDNKVREAASVIRAEPPPAPKIYVPADAHERALGHLPAGRQMLAICPSASWPFKMWPADRFADLVKRLVGSGGEVSWANRRHFFGAAAQAMRRILVERARRHRAAKHGGGRDRAGFHDDIAVDLPDDKVDMIALDDALGRLSSRDERKAEIVHLRYFAGLTIEETAAAMELSPATIKSEWSYARLWLFRELEAGA